MIAQEMMTTEVNQEYVIIVPRDATETEYYAADELSDYIFKINGVQLSVYTEDQIQKEKEIVIGDTDRDPKAEEPELYNDGYWLLEEDDKIYIQGDNDRGVLYGVYGFLEDVLGCRFYTSMVEYVPQRSALNVPEDMNIVKNPVFEFRDTNWHCALDREYAAKRGYNGQFSGLTQKEGRAITYHGDFVHTFDKYVPFSIYGAEHPEYYSNQIAGRNQLCLTNPDVLKIVTEGVLNNIRSNPNCTIFSISQNDCYNPCTCETCAAIDAEEGSHAGTLLRFINAIAEEVEKEFPDVIIDTLAYQYTRKPPKITVPRDNVAIRFCTIEACFSHPLSKCNAVSRNFASLVGDTSMQSDLAGWAKICDRIYIWDYTTDFHHYLMTFPNLYILGENIKYFRNNNVVGLFEQGNGESVSGEFGELRAYVISKLMWNPDGDIKSYIRDFLKGYYGDAAGPIGEYIDLICNHVEENNIHVSIYDEPDRKIFPDTLLLKAEELFARAEELVAGDKKLVKRVQRSGLQIRHIRLSRTSVNDPAKPEMAASFIEDVYRFQITRLKEWIPLEDSLNTLKVTAAKAQKEE